MLLHKVLNYKLAAWESGNMWRREHIPQTQANQSVGFLKETEERRWAQNPDVPFRVINAIYERKTTVYLPRRYLIAMKNAIATDTTCTRTAHWCEYFSSVFIRENDTSSPARAV